MTPSPAQGFRTLLAAAAATVRPDLPLRLLVRRRAPLASQGELRGHLDVLLRLSCHGDGHGSGVLVFDWPVTARGHSVTRLLEGLVDRADDDGRDRDGALRIECRKDGAARDRAPAIPSMHLKVFFDAAEIPDGMLELLGLAARMNILQQVREEIARYPQAEAAPATARNGAHGAAPKAETEPEPAPRPGPHPEQDKIDRIVNHAAFDGNLHPHVDPNGEVTNSNGEVFRLIMRRANGGLRRQWLRIGKELAHR